MLSDQDKATWEWQLDVPGLGEAGQEKLRRATALVSRIGGLGGPLAFSLAAAGIGKIILAHAGPLRIDDLNRQVLMRHEDLGNLRVDSARKTLRAFNPAVAIESVAENISEDNAAALVGRADIVFSCAPLFEERLLMNRECVARGTPLVDCAMYSMEGRVFPVVPGESACLACLYPEIPPHWKRRFPVLGAVSALVAQLGALEGIKLLTGLPGANPGKILHIDAVTMEFRKITVARNPSCAVCANPEP